MIHNDLMLVNLHIISVKSIPINIFSNKKNSQNKRNEGSYMEDKARGLPSFGGQGKTMNSE